MRAVVCRNAVRLPCATPSCFGNSYLTTPLPCSVSFPFRFCPTARSRVLPLYLSLVGTGSSCTLTKWRHWRARVCRYCYPLSACDFRFESGPNEGTRTQTRSLLSFVISLPRPASALALVSFSLSRLPSAPSPPPFLSPSLGGGITISLRTDP